jgi:hypothetical protein
VFCGGENKMEVGFDKEIDAILRKARGDEVVTSPDAHLDADEISAFAENALPETIRRNYTAHLADCTRCRKVLSNVVLLNSEAEIETASSAVPVEIKETKTPWYRKLLVFPQLAYAMGALVLLFSGFFGYLILQNLSGSKNSEVSYSTDKPNQMKESAPAANSSAPVFSNSNTASSSANATTTANSTTTTTATTTNSASTSAANTANTALPPEKKSDTGELNAPVATQPMVAPQATPSLQDSDDNKAEVSKDLARIQPKNEALKPSAGGAVVKEEDKRRDKEDSMILDGQESTDSLSRQKMKTQRAAPDSPKKSVSEAGATRSIGGKTFDNVGGIWFDKALGKQKQKTVMRGTKDYLKLDSGLRSIADQLGGSVVILWNGKAYRIQ